MKTADRFMRKVIPSTALLSHRRLLMGPLDWVDRLVSWPIREFRSLPPNRFRIRVGAANRLLFNQAGFLLSPVNFWFSMLAEGVITPTSNIVDVGCGCGRYARVLRDWQGPTVDGGFQGHYTGIDIDAEMIHWLNQRYPTDHFSFICPDVHSTVYNPKGKQRGAHLPLEADTQNLVFSTSLFSHLLEEELREYIRESKRVLVEGGQMRMTVFCKQHMEDRLGGRWTFSHRMGHAFVESLRYPEAAVAYDDTFLVELCRQAGFADAQVQRLRANQSMLVARS